MVQETVPGAVFYIAEKKEDIEENEETNIGAGIPAVRPVHADSSSQCRYGRK